MPFQVIVSHSAEHDLKELRTYIRGNFGQGTWQLAYRHIKSAITRLAQFPHEGSVPDELVRLKLPQFRQVIAGKNRIVYEIKQDTILVHLIADTRRDYRALLKARVTS